MHGDEIGEANNASILVIGPDGSVFLDVAAGEVRCSGEMMPPQALTASELAILRHLHSKKSHFATVDELYSLNHGADDGVKGAAQRKRSIQQHICNIRAKIARAGGSGDAILTSRATESYKLAVPDGRSVDFALANNARGRIVATETAARRLAMGISSGRIIDNAGRKALPIGVESFETLAQNHVYVDKTLLARELIDRCEYRAVLFCRPRRFGKSLALRMLKCFFEAPVADARTPIPDRARLFEGMAIAEAGERYTAEQGAHPVIYLSLSEAAGSTWEATRSGLIAAMANECARHDYLLDSDSLGAGERRFLTQLIMGDPLPGELERSLRLLSDLLARYHGANTVILIDEYDAPVTQGHLHGFRDEAVGFYRMWLTAALKSSTSLYLSVLTGVQRVSRESIFSGLNNITVDTALNHAYSEAFGFTEAEVGELAAYLGFEGCLFEMRDWYDGYVFGEERVYNPWSALNYLEEGGVAQPYWGNTSSNSIVHELFDAAEGATADELAALAAGGTVRQPIDLATVFDMIGRDPLAVWSQLYLAGYLTTEDTAEPNNPYIDRELRVPNREVGLLYRKEFADRSEKVAGSRQRLSGLHKALQAGDAPGLQAALRRILLDSPSALDLVRENSYHMLVLGLLYYVYGYKFPMSNREAGDGRADVLLAPERENEGKLPGIVIEVKHGKDLVDDALAALADEALAQARARSYADALPEGPVLLWGIAFSGKDVAVSCLAARPV